MARRVPAPVAASAADIYGFGCNQAQSEQDANAGASFSDLSSQWGGMHQNASYTLKNDSSHLRITCQHQHSHGNTWRAGGVRMGIKDGSNNWQYLIINASHSVIEGHDCAGNCGYSCGTLNPRDYISGAGTGTTLYFNLQHIQQDGGGFGKMNHWTVSQEGGSGQSDTSIGGMSMFVEEIPATYDVNQWDG